jgi:hypothetical protein
VDEFNELLVLHFGGFIFFLNEKKQRLARGRELNKGEKYKKGGRTLKEKRIHTVSDRQRRKGREIRIADLRGVRASR